MVVLTRCPVQPAIEGCGNILNGMFIVPVMVVQPAIEGCGNPHLRLHPVLSSPCSTRNRRVWQLLPPGRAHPGCSCVQPVIEGCGNGRICSVVDALLACSTRNRRVWQLVLNRMGYVGIVGSTRNRRVWQLVSGSEICSGNRKFNP